MIHKHSPPNPRKSPPPHGPTIKTQKVATKCCYFLCWLYLSHLASRSRVTKYISSLRSKSIKYSRPRLVCLVSLDMTAPFNSARTPSSWRAEVAQILKNSNDIAVFLVFEPPRRIELRTFSLRVKCSAN
jgi:hypothetical protein